MEEGMMNPKGTQGLSSTKLTSRSYKWQTLLFSSKVNSLIYLGATTVGSFERRIAWRTDACAAWWMGNGVNKQYDMELRSFLIAEKEKGSCTRGKIYN